MSIPSGKDGASRTPSGTSFGPLAHSGEHRACNAGAAGAKPAGSTDLNAGKTTLKTEGRWFESSPADNRQVAQMEEHWYQTSCQCLSDLVLCRLSSTVERLFYTERVGGANPSGGTGSNA